MSFASGSALRVAYVAETAFGVTPATPSFKTLRTTGGGMRTTKATATSAELNPDRNVRDEMLLGLDSAGAYNFELSYGSLDDLLEAALQGAWATNVLKNGNAPKSFTVEETLELGVTDSYARFTGAMVDSLSLALPSRGVITGSVNMMAKDETLATAIVSGATYAAANAKAIMTASAHVASLSAPGGGTPKIKSLNFDIKNNLRTRPVVGSKFSEEFGSGLCDVTGTLEAYFENNTLYQAVLDHGGGALSFTVGSVTNEKYTFLLPKIIFMNGEKRIGGNTDDVMVNIPFRAVYDETEACSLKITRAVA